ncbi:MULTISPECIES: kinase [unclassified Lysinibacillus]|uniref:GHMP family kinase ATP-binding protein n=1 Tax=unclassified Lysinibacillus TaxID=2636778 RepID=UPI0037FCAD2C
MYTDILNIPSKLPVRQEGTGISSGTFGEMLQGVLTNGKPFLVTLPINRFSKAIFKPSLAKESIEVIPEFKVKAKCLCEMILRDNNLPLGGTLEIVSTIPVGKGLASSSADLVAVSRAIESAYDFTLDINKLEQYLASIEPTDGVMYPSIVSYYHREAKLKDYIGNVPALTIVSHDEGGEINTIDFNRRYYKYEIDVKQEYELLLKKLITAINNNDYKGIGEITTRSAILHQNVSPKRTLNQMIDINNEINGLGVVIAHSGTYIGILISQHDEEYYEKLGIAKQLISKLSDDVQVMHTINQGEKCYGKQFN